MLTFWLKETILSYKVLNMRISKPWSLPGADLRLVMSYLLGIKN